MNPEANRFQDFAPALRTALVQSVCLPALALLLVASGFAQDCTPPTDPHAPAVPLCLVANQVTRTLDTFNSDASRSALPKLSKVVFDFKTSTGKGTGIGFQILIFTLGANRNTEATDDVVFSYVVPKPAPIRSAAKTHDFSTALLSTLQAAAAQVKQTQSVGGAKFTNLTVTLSYGVVWDATGGGGGSIGLVTVDGSVDRKRSDVQTLTLSFGP